MTRLFRAMKQDSAGLAEIAAHARGLGVRPGIDVPAGKADDVIRPGQGGLSVSPHDPLNLPLYRRPPEFQGVGKDPIWTITTTELGLDLCYRPDPTSAEHGFIEPVRAMTLVEYQEALARTQVFWRKAVF